MEQIPAWESKIFKGMAVDSELPTRNEKWEIEGRQPPHLEQLCWWLWRVRGAMAEGGKGAFKQCGLVLAWVTFWKSEKLVSNSSRPAWSPGLDRAPRRATQDTDPECGPCRELELLPGCSPLCWCRGGASQGLPVPQGTLQGQVVPASWCIPRFFYLFWPMYLHTNVKRWERPSKASLEKWHSTYSLRICKNEGRRPPSASKKGRACWIHRTQLEVQLIQNSSWKTNVS